MNMENMSIRQLIIELARTESDAEDGTDDRDRLMRQRALIRELRRRRQQTRDWPSAPGSAAG
jgi:hypothetical protein